VAVLKNLKIPEKTKISLFPPREMPTPQSWDAAAALQVGVVV
jgi:hypothetical protein